MLAVEDGVGRHATNTQEAVLVIYRGAVADPSNLEALLRKARRRIANRRGAW